jgi:hypothetical protein
MLRTKDVVERLKSVPPQAGQKPPLLVYLGVLLQKGKLNALESAELARCAAQRSAGAAAGAAAAGRALGVLLESASSLPEPLAAVPPPARRPPAPHPARLPLPACLCPGWC